MQVADNNQLATTATLGTQEAMSFAISDDPAFYQVLSANLYSNPKLAMCRETLCNLWDAHIEAGITDKPGLVEITEDNFLIFRDYGKGIPADLIGMVYGTYGASTKKTDSKQTGGFGLGCKSPFAYTDSFQVTSFNQGVKTIYSVSKSAVETGGRPGIIPIASFPTEESGLEVKIPIDHYDRNELVRYIRYIVLHGEMKILFMNDDAVPGIPALLPTLGMSMKPGTYNVDTGSWYNGYMGNHFAFVRYGNVVYPIPDSSSTEQAIKVLRQFMEILGKGRILIQAAPDTLALAPSRETLTNLKMTDDGITDLVVTLVATMEADIKAKIPAAMREIVEHYKVADRFHLSDWYEPTDAVQDRAVASYMKSRLWDKQRRHFTPYWRNLEINRMVELSGFTGRDAVDIERAIKLSKRHRMVVGWEHWENTIHKRWKQKRASELGSLGKDFVYLMDGHVRRNSKSSLDYQSWYGSVSMANQKYVLITRRKDVKQSFYDWCKSEPRNDGILFATIVKVGAKKREAEEAVQFYTGKGYNVINLTVFNEWDSVAQELKERSDALREERNAEAARIKLANADAEKEAIVKAMKPNRLISIKCMLLDEPDRMGSYLDTYRARERMAIDYNHQDVEKPEYWTELSDCNYSGTIGNLMLINEFTKEEMDKIVICRNGIEVNKAKKRGAKHISEFLPERYYKEAMTPAFIRYITKERQYALRELGVTSQMLKLADELGIKLKSLNKLRYVPEFEDIIKRFTDTRGRLNVSMRITQIARLANLAEEDIKHLRSISEMEGTLDAPNLKALQACFGIRGMFRLSPNDIRQLIHNQPEMKQGFKLLINNQIRRKKDENQSS